MKAKPFIITFALLASVGLAAAAPLGTAFSYRGQLQDGGHPANGTYDFQLTLWDALTNGTSLGAAQTLSAVPVSNGQFMVTLDFGSQAFDGDARWLECGVRTNGSTVSFTMLSPRQALAPVPYALYAARAAGVAATNITGVLADAQFPASVALLSAGGKLPDAALSTNVALLSGNPSLNVGGVSSSTDLSSPTYTHITIGGDYINPANPSGPDIFLPDQGGLRWKDGSSIRGWAGHGGTGHNEMQIVSPDSIAIEPGSIGTGGVCQMGWSNPYHETFNLQYDDWLARNWAGSPVDTNVPYPYGHSKVLNFIADMRTGTGSPVPPFNDIFSAWPGIMGVTYGTEMYPSEHTGPNSLRQYPLGKLQFYAITPSWRDNAIADGPPAFPGVMVGEMLTNGWNLRGKLIQQHGVGAMNGTSCPLDFNSSYCVSVPMLSATVRFYTTNRTERAADYEQRVFLLSAGIFAVTPAWPNWTWVGAVPASFGPGELMRLSLESVGRGETNVIASASVGTDRAFSLDADATDYIARAGITGLAEQTAVQVFVKGLKEDGVWTNLYACWPLYGTNATQTAQNLKGNAYTLVWHGDLTNNAYHTLTGVSNTATAGSWCDTTLNLNAWGASLANVHLMVWSESTVGRGANANSGDADCAMGVYSTNPYCQGMLFVGSASLNVVGPQAGSSDITAYYPYGTAAGFFIGQSSGPNDNYHGTTALFPVASNSGNATACADSTIGLFCIHDAESAARHLANLKLAGASVGNALNPTLREAYRARWQTLQSALGR